MHFGVLNEKWGRASFNLEFGATEKKRKCPFPWCPSQALLCSLVSASVLVQLPCSVVIDNASLSPHHLCYYQAWGFCVWNSFLKKSLNWITIFAGYIKRIFPIYQCYSFPTTIKTSEIPLNTHWKHRFSCSCRFQTTGWFRFPLVHTLSASAVCQSLN